MKGMDIRSERIRGYKHGSVRGSAFLTSQRLDMTELATNVYLVNRML